MSTTLSWNDDEEMDDDQPPTQAETEHLNTGSAYRSEYIRLNHNLFHGQQQ
ncbi:MAG: hypothetical protein GY820_26840 [Gammaproteobacteria bacterium]|nr:hypothetical protein [Gammaproteobacteria bacterium]